MNICLSLSFYLDSNNLATFQQQACGHAHTDHISSTARMGTKITSNICIPSTIVCRFNVTSFIRLHYFRLLNLSVSFSFTIQLWAEAVYIAPWGWGAPGWSSVVKQPNVHNLRIKVSQSVRKRERRVRRGGARTHNGGSVEAVAHARCATSKDMYV